MDKARQDGGPIFKSLVALATILSLGCQAQFSQFKSFNPNIATLEIQCVSTEDSVIDLGAFVFKISAGSVLASGSGTWLGKGNVLTAAHVVTGCAQVEGALRDLDSGALLSPVKVDNAIDLALLSSSIDLESGPARVAFFEPQIGDRITMWGFPMGNDTRVVTSGLISGWIDADYGDGLLKHQWLTDTQGINGCSGGGVYDIRGHLIGVYVGGTQWGQADRPYALGLIVPWADLKEFLKDI